MVHRNTYINGPSVLRETWQTKTRDDLFFAGQISGVEGYVESAASGLIAGRNAAALLQGRQPSAPPRATAIGALGYYVSHADPRHYQPTNITFGIMPPPDLVRGSLRDSRVPPQSGSAARTGTGEPGRRPSRKADRKTATAERALEALADWLGSERIAADEPGTAGVTR
jgi:methylenetetrahydrofolate--tRNA-(uracil-5-)-methyltransferase